MQDILLIHTQKATLTYIYSSLKLTVCLITIHKYKTLNINLAFMHMKSTNKISILTATGKQVDVLLIIKKPSTPCMSNY